MCTILFGNIGISYYMKMLVLSLVNDIWWIIFRVKWFFPQLSCIDTTLYMTPISSTHAVCLELMLFGEECPSCQGADRNKCLSSFIVEWIWSLVTTWTPWIHIQHVVGCCQLTVSNSEKVEGMFMFI